MRAYLPLKVFSDQYFVVFWDIRGNGLSERCIEEMVHEIEAMKDLYSPHEPITLMGHSWSAFFAARYLAEYPEHVAQAILVEPNGLKDDFMKEVGMSLNLFTEGYMDMMYTTKYLTAKDQETLDFQALAMLTSGVRDFYCDENNITEWPVWRVGALALMVWENSLLTHGKYDFDYTAGLDQYPNEVLIVGTSCSPIGYHFQETYHQPLFKDAEVLRIENSGHRILTEQFQALVNGLQWYLSAYQP